MTLTCEHLVAPGIFCGNPATTLLGESNETPTCVAHTTRAPYTGCSMCGDPHSMYVDIFGFGWCDPCLTATDEAAQTLRRQPTVPDNIILGAE